MKTQNATGILGRYEKKSRSSNSKSPLSDANFPIGRYLINEIELFEMWKGEPLRVEKTLKLGFRLEDERAADAVGDRRGREVGRDN